MNLAQLRLIMNAFILSQFGYCPLVWVFHSRKLNNRITSKTVLPYNHQRAFKIVFSQPFNNF